MVSTEVANKNTEGLYGVFNVAEAHVALPLSELREVIPCPASFERLLATAPGLVGAVNLRHQVIPVLDLRRVIGMADDTAMEIIVIVSHQQNLFGLLASAVGGVVRVKPEEMFELEMAGDARPLFTHSFERTEDQTVVCVLETAVVRAIPGLPMVRDTGLEPSLRASELDNNRRTVMLLRCGDIGLCIDVTHVHSVIPELLVKSSSLDGPQVRGVVHLGDHEVPVVDPLSILNLGHVDVQNANRGVALRFPRGLIVLAVSEVVSIVPVANSSILPLPPFGMPASTFLAGILSQPDSGPFLLLDGNVVRNDEALDNLAALGLPIGNATGAAGAGGEPTVPGQRQTGTKEGDPRTVSASVRKFLTYTAGVDIATPLVQITEILPYPSDLIPFEGTHGSVRGIFTHRGTGIPLVCLTTLLGRWEELDPVTSRVLLIEADQGYVGFAVPQLRAIEESVWEEQPEGAPDLYSVLTTSPLVEVGDEGQTRMLPNIDLRAVAVAAW